MCARTDSAREVQSAAECLSRACIATLPEPMKTLRQIYSEPLNEETPDWVTELLKRLQ